MTERSYPWGGLVTGDATLAPYTQDAWSDIWRELFVNNPVSDGVIKDYASELGATGAVSPVAIATGAAMNTGTYYNNDLALNVAVDTPVGDTRYDRIVLRKDWAAQTVRITLVEGVEGAGVPPTLTQIDGNTWDIPLWTVEITILGAITLTDTRYWLMGNIASPAHNYPADGRLTLTTATPVTTADVTAATTLYYTPFVGNRIALFNGSRWIIKEFAELTLDISGYTASKPYDIWAYLDTSDDTVKLDSTIWTNGTTRATALAKQDSIYVKTGATTRRYLGTIYITTVAGQCEDSETSRLVWNYYNRVTRFLEAHDTTNSWTYTTATWRASNNSTALGVARVELIIGVAECEVRATANGMASNDTVSTSAASGIGIDSVTVNSAQVYGGGITTTHYHGLPSYYRGYPAVGYHYISQLEISAASNTTTWVGDNNLAYWQTGLVVEFEA